MRLLALEQSKPKRLFGLPGELSSAQGRPGPPLPAISSELYAVCSRWIACDCRCSAVLAVVQAGPVAGLTNSYYVVHYRRTYVVLTGKAVPQYSIPGRVNSSAVVEAKTQCAVLNIWFCKRQVQSKIWRVTNKFEQI